MAGKNVLDYIRYKNTETNEITEYRAENGDTFGVFVFAGYSPDTSLIKGIAELDGQGYAVTDSGKKTSVDGLYAAGDVCVKPLRQVVTATSDGALAAAELEKYAAKMQEKTGLHPKQPVTRENIKAHTPETPDDAEEIFTAEMKQQLNEVFEKMERNLLLELSLDDRPVSAELESFITKLSELSDKLEVTVGERNASSGYAPCVRVCYENGEDTGIAFHGVPGGHEFTSFVLGLYNASGPGQKIDDQTCQKIRNIKTEVDMKVLVSLSCTMCPDLVIVCQRIAAENPNIRAEVFDLQHFEVMKNKYNVMSVPCLVINDDKVSFGKKNINQIIELTDNI